MTKDDTSIYVTEPGEYGWTPDGRYAMFVVRTQGVSLVRDVRTIPASNEEPEHEILSDKIYSVSNVYKAEPEPVLGPLHSRMLDQQVELSDEIAILRKEKRQLEEQKELVRNQATNYEGLETLLSIMDGSITHAVTVNKKGLFLHPFRDLMKHKTPGSAYGKYGLKILTLYGTEATGFRAEERLDDDLNNPVFDFKISRKGTASEDIELFSSEDEAVSYIKSWFDRLVSKVMLGDDNRSKHHHECVMMEDMVERFDFLELPQKYVDDKNAKRIQRLDKRIDELQAELDECRDAREKGGDAHIPIRPTPPPIRDINMGY